MADPTQENSSTEEAPPPEKGETFVSHLVELRDALVRATAGWFGVFILLCIYPGPGRVYDVLAQPMINTLPAGAKMIATGVITPFFVPLKVTLLAAFMIALPWVLWQVWRFVAPGLYQHERRLALPIISSSVVLFFIGVAFCYFFVFGNVFKFIAQFAPQSIQVAPDIEQYLDFVMTMFLAFGLTFEVPIVVVVLVLLGMVSVLKLREVRGYIAIAVTVIAAVVTPPDVFSQLALAIPMYLLYELGIFVASFLEKDKAA